MDNMEVKLNILLDGLKKKEQALIEIVNITENERTVIGSELPLEDMRAFIAEMSQSKQAFIQQVKGCDLLFEAVLKEIGPTLDERQDMYTTQVLELQKYIRRVMDLDVKVRVSEEQNSQLLQDRQPIQPQQRRKQSPIPLDSTRIIKAYERNKKF